MTNSFIQRIKNLDPIIIGIVFGLLVFGLIMLISASGPVAVQRMGDSLFFVKRQLSRGILPGLALFAFFALIDYRKWRNLAGLFLVGSIALLALVYVPGIGVRLGGSLSWIQLGGVQFQPSEIVKFLFLLYMAAWLSNREGKEAHELETGLVPFMIALGTIVGLLVFQPDTGSMAVVLGMSLIMYFVSGAPIIWFVSMCGMGAGLLWVLIKTSAYRAQRFMTFLHPEWDPKGIGYHINQAILAIGSGGLLGLGYGHSRQKFLYLPEVESDSIIAVIGEEMGFVVMCLLVIAYGFLIWRCLKIAKQSKDKFGAYIAVGAAGWLLAQTILNIGSMIGLMPITGVTLPFISYGGSSVLILLAVMGLVAGIPASESSSRR